MGLQNADQFETADDVKYFYRLGLRCAQLTYNSQNLIGSGSTDRIDGGVSDFGEEIIKAMNKAGMLVDTSHCGRAHDARRDRAVAQADRRSPIPTAGRSTRTRATRATR